MTHETCSVSLATPSPQPQKLRSTSTNFLIPPALPYSFELKIESCDGSSPEERYSDQSSVDPDFTQDVVSSDVSTTEGISTTLQTDNATESTHEDLNGGVVFETNPKYNRNYPQFCEPPNASDESSISTANDTHFGAAKIESESFILDKMPSECQVLLKPISNNSKDSFSAHGSSSGATETALNEKCSLIGAALEISKHQRRIERLLTSTESAVKLTVPMATELASEKRVTLSAACKSQRLDQTMATQDIVLDRKRIETLHCPAPHNLQSPTLTHDLYDQASEKVSLFTENNTSIEKNAMKACYGTEADTVSQASGIGDTSLEVGIGNEENNALLFAWHIMDSNSLQLSQPPPHFSVSRNDILTDFCGKKVYLFLDYDGTLTPIVSNPWEAKLSPSMRELLYQLAANSHNLVTVGIVTGRALTSVKNFVQIMASERLNFIYAASHGFHIEAAGKMLHHKVGSRYIPILKKAAVEVEQALSDIPGVTLEDNEFAVSVHYRNAPKNSEQEVERIVDGILQRFPALKKTRGKKVFELRINVPWDKGRAVFWLLNAMRVDPFEDMTRVVYIGDDLTDEDAFRAVRQFNNSLTVLVSEEPASRPTAAAYFVKNPAEVAELLQDLLSTTTRGNVNL